MNDTEGPPHNASMWDSFSFHALKWGKMAKSALLYIIFAFWGLEIEDYCVNLQRVLRNKDILKLRSVMLDLLMEMWETSIVMQG